MPKALEIESPPTNLNSIRLVLASCVIIGHSSELIDGSRIREPFTVLFGGMSLGEFAVRGFFLLSGYLIAGSWIHRPKLGEFLLKRVLRIYPAFIVCSLLCVALGYSVGGTIPPWSKVIRLIACLFPPQAAGAFAGTNFPMLNGAIWSLFYEFACYLLIAFLGLLGLLRMSVVTGLFFLTSYVTIFGSHGNLPGQEMAYQFFLLFPPFLVPCFLAGSTLYFCPGLRPKFKWRLPNITQDISYGLFLYGWPTQKLILWFWPKLEPWQLTPLALGAAGVCGFASWKLIEQPCLSLKNKLPKPSAANPLIEQSRSQPN